MRRDALEATLAELVSQSPWAPTAARLRCLRGIETMTAVGLCAEIGDWQRFARVGQLASYLGIVPSEDSSGDWRRLGSITKDRLTPAGCSSRPHGTTAAHRAAAAMLAARQHGQPAHVLALAWKVHQRVHHTWQRVDHQRGKSRTVVAVAVARELAGFCWAIARAD